MHQSLIELWFLHSNTHESNLHINLSTPYLSNYIFIHAFTPYRMVVPSLQYRWNRNQGWTEAYLALHFLSEKICPGKTILIYYYSLVAAPLASRGVCIWGLQKLPKTTPRYLKIELNSVKPPWNIYRAFLYWRTQSVYYLWKTCVCLSWKFKKKILKLKISLPPLNLFNDYS